MNNVNIVDHLDNELLLEKRRHLTLVILVKIVLSKRYFYIFMIVEIDMPDHDLEPPRFSRKALERLLNDWPAVKAMIMSGVKNDSESKLPTDQPYLKNQSGTTFLDKFMHCLLFKCNAEVITSSYLVS